MFCRGDCGPNDYEDKETPTFVGFIKANSRFVLAVLTFGIVVHFNVGLAHEALGHGLACSSRGGTWEGVTSAWMCCTFEDNVETNSRLVDFGGVEADFAFGIFFGLLWKFWPAIAKPFGPLRPALQERNSVQFFLWLSMILHLLHGTGYLLVSPLFGFGDFGESLTDIPGEAGWRIGLALFGAVGQGFLMYFTLYTADSYLGRSKTLRIYRGIVIFLLPYFTSFLMNILSALAMGPAIRWMFFFTSGFASALGGGFVYAWCAPMVYFRKDGSVREVAKEPPWPINCSYSWMIFAAIEFIVFIVVFGPGLPYGISWRLEDC